MADDDDVRSESPGRGVAAGALQGLAEGGLLGIIFGVLAGVVAWLWVKRRQGSPEPSR